MLRCQNSKNIVLFLNDHIIVFSFIETTESPCFQEKTDYEHALDV